MSHEEIPYKRGNEVVIVVRTLVVYQNMVLIMKRFEEASHNPGLWEAPGGKLNRGECIPDAFDREVTEETGLTIVRVSPIVLVEDRMITEGPYAGLPYMSLFCVARSTHNAVRMTEHEEFRWIRPIEAGILQKRLTTDSCRAIRLLHNYLP